MYFIIRGALILVLVVAASTISSGKVADFTAEQGLNDNLRVFLTGLAGVMTALIVAAVFLLLGLLRNRE